MNSMGHTTVSDSTPDEHRVHAEELLGDAQRNPVLSDTQSCAVAQVHALLSIERRLAQLCASLDAALVALGTVRARDDADVAAEPSWAS